MNRTEDLLRETFRHRAAEHAPDTGTMIPGVFARYRRRRRRTVTASAALVLVAAAMTSVLVVGSSDKAADARSYPLPTTGASADAPYDLAAATGRFHAWMTSDGACASVGDTYAFVWPSHFRVTLHPVRLLDQHGKVVAKGGELVTVGGAPGRAGSGDRCARHGQQVWSVGGYPERGK